MGPALVAFLMLVWASPAPAEEARSLNGFTIERHTVPREKILPGGPQRDGIKSVDEPVFVSAEEASWVAPDTPVIGVAIGDQARAYPVHLIEYHQIVNDEIGGTPVAVTYDPLSGTPIAYRRTLDDRVLTFGVSGLIYKANFLLYDRETESLWSQFRGQALSGPLSGRSLTRVPTRQEPMGAWLQRHPKTVVLTRPEPRKIDYRYSPFRAYWVSENVPFPLDDTDARYHPKEVALGIEVGGKARAYLGSILTAAGGRIVDDFEGHRIRVAYDAEASAFLWEAPDDVVVTDAYWFAWKNFYPGTEIWRDMNPSVRQPSPSPQQSP
ncbi:MAG: DUF3179 domain-containing protein [Proteobacteria bacterium]|nr:DUF3179 domain-containing protein [Pseudomonadota bacterium]